jgi:hypothetical protein
VTGAVSQRGSPKCRIRATFSVVTRGGGDALLASFGANSRFERVDPTAGGTIAFRLRQ